MFFRDSTSTELIMPPRKAQAVSIASLSKSVDAAIRLAAARNEIAVDKLTFIDRWEIIGRRLRNAKDLAGAFRMAEDVARRVKVPGVVPVPAVTRIGKDILVGFIDRGGFQKLTR